MATTKSPSTVKIQEASLSNLQSLTTIVPRAFHPGSPFHQKCFPDTPAVRAWWETTFRDEISCQTGHVLLALDQTTAEEEDEVVGVLCMRHFPPQDGGAGFWTMYDYTSDHDMTLFQPAIDAMVRYRPELLGARAHYLVELFGVDHDYKGRGVGRELLERACGRADGEGLPVFVEANEKAAAFYEKFGFERRGQVPVQMPGGQPDYWEYLLVRPEKSER